ncbi:hypothetical protein N0V90_009328 [Kalmusia sp. IMI 367209]|nr:hypothetical protein N0V90_009328 [Kalmusia sp. IMI 367209]
MLMWPELNNSSPLPAASQPLAARFESQYTLNKMRLRLTVQRNSLPTSNILWSVPDTSSLQAYTVARLLEDVNRILPLEAEQWGLEDYIVEVGGFECFHFSPVLQTLKEDDHVSIRPLLTAEVRSRTLCGRNQISADGRHLVDGIPFGRPYLRQPHRPAVIIPPRKRRRLEEDTVGEGDMHDDTGLITAAGEASSPGNANGSKNGRKEVQFVQADGEVSDDSEDDEDFVPGHVSDGSVDSESDSESSSAASEASVQHNKSQPSGGSERKPKSRLESDPDSSSASEVDSSSASESDSNSDSDTDSDSDSDSTDSNSKSDSSEPEVRSSKRPVAPGSGSSETRKRNARRRQTSQLKQLKAEGKLHPDATYTDLHLYQQTHTTSILESSHLIPAKTMATPTGKRKRLDEEEVEDPKAETLVDESAELERRKQELMAKLAENTPDIEMTSIESSNGAVEQAEETSRASASPAVTPNLGSRRSTDTPTPSTKRLRPDISAIGRILQRQAVNVERKTPKSKKQPVVEEPPEPEGSSDPDFWTSRINVSAFECWDEDHELSAPPFPFEQHWDPASKIMRENANKKKKKARKSRTAQMTGADNEDEEEEETPILDYDDSPETLKQSSDLTDAIESQLLQDVELAAKTDLPSLPENVESLADLQPSDVQVGAIIVFKLWTIDPATVTPQISNYKTAIVEKEGDSGGGAGTFTLKFADRDVAKKEEKKIDERGNPIRNAASGFKMGDDDEEEDDESIWEGMFAELVTPKLLKAAD